MNTYFLILLILLISFLFFKTNTKEFFTEDVNYIWSKYTILNNTDYNFVKAPVISSNEMILKQIKQANDILWIRNGDNKKNSIKTDLDIFSEMIDKLNKPVILITTDGVRDVPSTYNNKTVQTILNSPKIKKWYTQNYDRTIIHPKLNHYPIGLDLHSYLNNNNNLEKKKSLFFNPNILKIKPDAPKKFFDLYIEIRNKHKDNKINKIFCDTHLSNTHPSRKNMGNIIKNNKMIHFQNKRIPHKDILNMYAKHRFVLSPRGNGLDCHRTWEIFLLGSVVITQTSPLDSMYLNNNLPVVIVNDYNELNNISNEQLNIWWNNNYEKTLLDNILEKSDKRYWIK